MAKATGRTTAKSDVVPRGRKGRERTAAPLTEVAPPTERAPVGEREASVTRQFELVERVRSYDTATDEEALNRAYVFAMKAHGAQFRESGAPYFTRS